LSFEFTAETRKAPSFFDKDFPGVLGVSAVKKI
jgi:hypothetical protein